MADDWQLSDEQRQETIARVTANIASLAFFRGKTITGDVSASTAEAIEKKAYTVARVEARTTTGVRPHAETLEAYTRCTDVLDCKSTYLNLL